MKKISLLEVFTLREQGYLICSHKYISCIDNYFPKKFIFAWLIFRLRQSHRISLDSSFNFDDGLRLWDGIRVGNISEKRLWIRHLYKYWLIRIFFGAKNEFHHRKHFWHSLIKRSKQTTATTSRAWQWWIFPLLWIFLFRRWRAMVVFQRRALRWTKWGSIPQQRWWLFLFSWLCSVMVSWF